MSPILPDKYFGDRLAADNDAIYQRGALVPVRRIYPDLNGKYTDDDYMAFYDTAGRGYFDFD